MGAADHFRQPPWEAQEQENSQNIEMGKFRELISQGH